ncbi:MAG TPA: pseudouridine synthase [Acidobacteriota bacterium]
MNSTKTKATLDRALSRFGIASRTKARDQIIAGRVSVNGKVERNPERWVDLKRDHLAVNHVEVRRAARKYWALNKPKGVITTHQDKLDRKTVYDLLPPGQQHIFSVGRLDKNTSGLLLLTNDNDFANYLTDPSFKVPKTYLVKVSGKVEDSEIEKLRGGVELSDGFTLPARVNPIRTTERHSWFELTIHEGRNRQVRRMFEALEHIVLKLVRVQVGKLKLGALKTGELRELTARDVGKYFSYPPRSGRR